MFISAVILSYNSDKTLDRCLGDLVEALDPFARENEIFVVDNGSRDSSRKIIHEYKGRYPELIHSIIFAKNTGTTFSRNAALRNSSGEYLLILDSDAYVNHNALALLIQHLSEHPKTGIAAPRLFYGSGKYQLSCDVFPTVTHKLRRFLFLRKMEDCEHELRTTSVAVDVDYAISACWVIRRDAFLKTGLFDKNIFYSPEDVDYCLRIWESGFKITYVPDAEVIHDAQELSRGFRLSRFHFSHLWGMFYLHRKHKYFWNLKKLYRRLNRFD